MKIAVEGCCHGELDKIYETLQFLEQKEGIKINLLLCCGDFQAVRNRSDLQCMAVPPKYQRMNTFWKYYSGEKKAPVLTIFIGGNHEASNYLQELPYGGWVAENIFYLGYAGVVNFGGVRIGGLSGIYKSRDFNKGHFEYPPYSEETKRTAYHIRNLEIFRLKQIGKPIDIFMTHDWPRGVYNYGDTNSLLRRKQFFREEVENGTLGSVPAEELLFKLKPGYWFSAHLHVKFAAMIQHELGNGNTKCTKFLALDKCLPRRQFLQVVDIPHDEAQSLKLALDAEWLCILKSTNHLLSLTRANCYMPGPGCKERHEFTPTEDDIKKIKGDFGEEMTLPENFEPSAPIHKNNGKFEKAEPPKVYVNPQTTLICEMLDIKDPNSVFSGYSSKVSADVSVPVNPDEIDVGDDDVEDEPDEDYTFLESSVEAFDTSGCNLDISSTSANISGDDFGTPKSDISRNKFSTPLALDKPINLKVTDISLVDDGEDTDTGLGSGSQAGTGDSDTQSLPSGFDLGISRISERSFDKSADDSPLESSASELDTSKTDSELVQPKLKKFKRRNQAIYTSNEED